MKSVQTRHLDLLYEMNGPNLAKGKKRTLEIVEQAARSRNWSRDAKIDAVDERVLWTLHERHLTLWFREKLEPLEATG